MPVSGWAQGPYVLTVAETGSGTVTSSDGNISCPGVCTYSYPSVTSVTLNAMPASGWSFSGWGGACAGTASCVVTMSQAQLVSAKFNLNCPTEPAQNVPISTGETYYGSNCVLNTTGDVDTFQFQGSAGDTWGVTLGAGPSRKVDVCFALYAPSNPTPIYSGCTFGSAAAVGTSQKLAGTGSYTIAVTEANNAVQTYALSLERFSPVPPDAVQVFPSKNVTVNLLPPTAQSIFFFYGQPSGTYRISESRNPSPVYDVCFDVYQPDGTNILRAACTFGNTSTVLKNIVPTQTGVYLIDSYIPGNYGIAINNNLQVTCLLGSCSAPLTVSSTGGGTVTSADGNINCGTSCSFLYFTGTPVTLTAAPAPGFTLASWSGCDSTSGNTCTATLNNARTVTATFTQTQLTVSETGSGTVTSADGNINCPATCSSGYPSGTPVTLTATPTLGWVFFGWSGCDTSSGNTCSVVMNSSRTVTASFEPLLMVTKTGSGTVTSGDGIISCGSVCSSPYPILTSVTLTATPAMGYAFTGWGGACSGTGSCVVSMTQAQSVSAAFTPTYLLTVNEMGQGTVTSTDGKINCTNGSGVCSATYLSGASVTLTATPASGWSFTSWSGCDSTSGNTCTVTMNSARGVTATFTQLSHTLAISVTGSGTVSSADGFINCPGVCSHSYLGGTAVTLTPAAAAGWSFTASGSGWSGACSGNGSCIVTMNSNLTATATFTQLSYQLTVLKVGSGTVTSTDSSINCGSVCSFSYLSGTSVTLTATPAAGWTFASWSNCDSTSGNICTVTMNSARTVTATFTQLSYQLTVAKVGSGTVTSADGNINCGSVCSFSYLSFTPVTLTATPATGWTFTSWSGCDSTSGNTCTVTMNNARSVTATFTQLSYLLTVSKNGSGTVTSTDGNINCGSVCSFSYLSGTSVTLTATPASGWTFTSWTGCDSTSGNTCTVTMNSARNVTATFTQVFQLTVSVTGSGTVTSSDGHINCPGVCSYSYPIGTSVTLNANPFSGWAFTGWSGACSGTNPSCTVSMTQAQSVSAIFVQLYQLTVSVAGSGTVTSTDGNISCGASCSHNYPNGTTVTLTATPASGWSLASGGWTGCSSTAGLTCTVVINGSNASVTARFVQITYQLTVGVTGNGTVTSTDGNINCPTACSFNYPSGTTVTLNANPASGWSLYGWTGCDLVNGNSCILTMNSAHGVSAIFVQTTYSLSVFPIGTGNGTITSSDGDIHCLSACSSIYPIGTTVTLTANPGFDATFSGWSGVCTGTNLSCTFSMTQAQSVTASFSSGFGGLRFVPVTPCRVADTRNPDGLFGGPPIAGGSSRDFPIPLSSCGIPPDAQAFALNISVVPHGFLGYLTVWPTGVSKPLVALLNSHDGRIKDNAAIVAAGLDGSISAYVTDTTDLIIDVSGYFVPDTTQLEFYPITPCRVLDTRNATDPLGGPELLAGQERDFPILASSCNIPPTAQAYSLNFSVVPDVKLGHLTVWPTGQQQPNVSNLNDPTGTVTANAGIVPAGTGGSISTYVTDQTHLIVDINGYFAPPGSGGLSLYLTYPCRLYDTRTSDGSFQGQRAINVTGAPCAIPANAQAVVLNATVLPQGFFGHLTLWPHGETQPNVSTLNARDGAFTSNMAIVPTLDGLINAFMTNTADLILDISSYFAP